MNIKDKLHYEYKIKKKRIQERLGHFKQFYKEPVEFNFSGNQLKLNPSKRVDDHRLFEELCFCIFTANTSAEMGAVAVDAVRHLLIDGSAAEMKQKLEGIYRFKNLRPAYIVHTRGYLKGNFDFKLKEKIESFKDKDELRDFFALNKGIKGLSFKEASHFLRNIGFSGYAILDKHIINSLHEFGYLKTNDAPKNRDQYLEIEGKFIDFSKEMGINMDEMDLLLWSRKTGKILK